MITAIITLSIILIVSVYVNINLLRKNEDMTDRIMDQDDIIFSIQREVTETYDEMKRIDSQGAFHEDDEVGEIFKGIKNAITKLRENIDG